jgi:predicted XRE-type DNA-binding protein
MRARQITAKSKSPRSKRKKVEIGSGNVFADLGFKDSEERLLKAEVASKIAQLIEEKDWTEAQTAARTGVEQPEVSRLLRGQLSDFRADDLSGALNRICNLEEPR